MKQYVKTNRILLILLVTILLFAVFLLGVMGVLIHGPSAEAERLFVLSVNETSALKFLPHIYLSDAQVDAILHPVSTSTDDEPSPDDNFVELPYEDGRTVEDENTNAGQVVVADPSENTGESGEWLEVVDIKGSTFKGKLMIIRDPSKVVVGTLDAYGANYHGLYLYEFIDKYNAIGGTNAGGFYDPGGGGNGGIPDGLVMRGSYPPRRRHVRPAGARSRADERGQLLPRPGAREGRRAADESRRRHEPAHLHRPVCGRHHPSDGHRGPQARQHGRDVRRYRQDHV